MANNHIVRKRTWTNSNVSMFFFLCIVLIAGATRSNAQKISGYYTSSQQGHSTIYYIFPQHGFSYKKSSLVYDITYLTDRDSSKINFSFFDHGGSPVDSISFITADGKKITSKTERIFIAEHKHSWEYRYSCSILFSDLKLIFGQNAPTIIVYTRSTSVSLHTTRNSWKKHAARTEKILQLFTLNQ